MNIKFGGQIISYDQNINIKLREKKWFDIFYKFFESDVWLSMCAAFQLTFFVMIIWFIFYIMGIIL